MSDGGEDQGADEAFWGRRRRRIITSLLERAVSRERLLLLSDGGVRVGAHTRQGLQEKAGFLGGSPACVGHPYCMEVMLCNVLVALTVALGATVALLLAPSDADLPRSADTDYMSIH